MAEQKAIPRREFLARAAALGVASGAGLLAPQTQAFPPPPREIKLDTVSQADFAPYLGTRFRIHPPKGLPVDVILLQVNGLRPQTLAIGVAPKRDPFSLVFQGSPRYRLPQKMYTIDHAKLGTMNLFLVPVDQPELGHYEAIFT